jgi:multifunctional beta-oxidation protein
MICRLATPYSSRYHKLISKGLLKKSMNASPSKQASPAVEFKDKVVIVTGAGAGLGRIYAIMFAKLGANVVINDVSQKGAESVVEECKKCELRTPLV